jgi:hypothetical protein
VDRESKQKERETVVPSAEPLLLLLNEWLFCAPAENLPVDRESKQEKEKKEILVPSAAPKM